MPSDNFGSSSGPTWMDSLGCSGTEAKLAHCQFGNSNAGWEDVDPNVPCNQTGLQCLGKYHKNNLYLKIGY